MMSAQNNEKPFAAFLNGIIFCLINFSVVINDLIYLNNPSYRSIGPPSYCIHSNVGTLANNTVKDSYKS